MALLDLFVADMSQPNDAYPAGIDAQHQRAHRAVISMGHLFQGRSAPDYWLSRLLPGLRSTYLANPWDKIRGWMVVNRSPSSNRFVNGRVAIRKFQIYVLRQSTMTWQLLVDENPSDGNYYDGNVYTAQGPASKRVVSGVTEFKQSTNPNWTNIHVYGPTAAGINYGGDIIGIHARCEARLVLDDGAGPNDLATAQLLFNVGIDLYPTTASEVSNGAFEDANYVPGAGGSRFRLLTTDWGVYTFTTVLPASNPMPDRPLVETWGYTASAAERTMTEAFFRANPPPTDDVDPQPDTPALLLPATAQAGSVVRARFVTAAGAPVSGATVSWQAAAGGVVYGVTNDQGVAVVRLTTVGAFTLSASGGGVSASASIVVADAAVANAVASSETPTSWVLAGSGPTMTGGQADIYGGTRWGLFTQGSPSGGNPSAVQYETSSLLSTGRINGSVIVKRGNQDWVTLYVFGSTDAPHASARAWFNLATGQIGVAESLGSGANPLASIDPWGDGFYRISLSVDLTAGGGDSMLLLRVDNGNQAYTFPSGATVTLGAAMLSVGAPQQHLPTDLVTPVAIHPATLPMAQTGQPYGATIICAGVPPITWSIAGSLPAGVTADTGQTSTTLTLSSSSVVATSAATFTVNATDGTSSDSEPFTIPVGSTAVDPSGLAAAAANSDTINLTWGLNGAPATSTVVEAQWFIGGDWTAWAQVAEVGPAETAAVVSGLRPHTQCRFRVFQRTAMGQTGYTDVVTATTERLRVVVHFEPAAAGVTGCMVTVGRGASPGTGLLFPLQVIQAFTGIAFDGPVTWTQPGDEPRQYARITVDLAEQPPGAKLRDGDRIEMVVQGMDGSKVYQSKILHGTEPSGAVVIEEP